jgi:hypothetical protein
VHAALAWLAGGGTPAAATGAGLGVRARTAETPDADGGRERWDAIAEAVDDVVTAVVRLGVERALGSPSVDEAEERLAEVVGDPAPLGVARWVGRLRHALATFDVELTARQLDEGARLVVHLREGAPSREGRARLLGWLGTHAPGAAPRETLSVRTLFEIGREWVAGFHRGEIQRRYLVDLASGEVFREERLRGAPASLGPCPRAVSLAFGEVEPGASPRRIRVLQYAVALEVRRDAWEKIEEHGRRDFVALADDYRHAVQSCPGLSEPFAVVLATASLLIRLEVHVTTESIDTMARVLGVPVLRRRVAKDALVRVYRASGAVILESAERRVYLWGTSGPAQAWMVRFVTGAVAARGGAST